LSYAILWIWILFFFFSSRRRHTRFDCDWSSDVCSSDLRQPARPPRQARARRRRLAATAAAALAPAAAPAAITRASSWETTAAARSEERRVGKECRLRWLRQHHKIKSVQARRY